MGGNLFAFILDVSSRIQIWTKSIRNLPKHPPLCICSSFKAFCWFFTATVPETFALKNCQFQGLRLKRTSGQTIELSVKQLLIL
jgi:hypothetical protein